MSLRLFGVARSAVRRCLTTEASSASSSAPPPVTDPKIVGLVDNISLLTLLQAADLVSLLKVCCR
ncbi:hypothetical protein AG1IA_02794 [Rhizoctonia solani AG-1 IA]|uniref:Uncharacterized protein n=1 Tax=Thanatephorus cucumeris (strain AG1-IA) TaxID=983506 RepID=L8X274_THACA|nr:hypothetical protein AG1IA_02794 [Rhizoctonia solani AG-1 IA]